MKLAIQFKFLTDECFVAHFIFYDCSSRGTGFISGHADGSIIRYYVSDDSTVEQQVNKFKDHVHVDYFLEVFLKCIR